MKLQRLIAEDSTTALQKVKDTLGINAVILSTRTHGDKVEIIAATDVDESIINSDFISNEANDNDLQSLHGDEPTRLNSELLKENQVSHEVKLLREMIESQLAGLTWQGISTHNPLQVIILKKLIEIGFNVETAEELVHDIEFPMSEHQAWGSVKDNISKHIQLCDQDIIEQGGAYFFIGPTGVGKTTTIAKLAARACLKYGSENCGLISVDNNRIAAYEQLLTYGQILRVNVNGCEDLESLNHSMRKLKDKKLILIDSSGFNPMVDSLQSTLSLVKQCDYPIEPIMVLSATSQTNILVKALSEYKHLANKKVILTKTDESFTIANALCALFRSNTPLLYLTNGQKVPEDITKATNYQLFSLLNNSLSNIKEDESIVLKELVSRLIKGEPHGK